MIEKPQFRLYSLPDVQYPPDPGALLRDFAARWGAGRSGRMTRAGLIERILQKSRITRLQAEILVEAILGCLQESLSRGEPVELRGFGTFDVRHYGPYRGRNPRTGQAVAVEARRLPFFRASPALVDRVNKSRQPPARLVHRGPGVLRKSTGITGVWMAVEQDAVPKADEITRRMG
jgi:integration host factor subunit beta